MLRLALNILDGEKPSPIWEFL